MKKIFLSLLIIITSFMLIGGVSADNIKGCKYGNYKLEFTHNNVYVYFNDKVVVSEVDYDSVSVSFDAFSDNKCPEEVYIGVQYNSDKSYSSLIISIHNYSAVSNNKKYTLDKEYSEYNNFENGITSCGNGLIDKIPTMIPRVVSMVYKIIQVAAPILLVIMGMFDFAKAMSAGKEEDIKKNQKNFIKRLISGLLIFCVFVIVKFVVSLVADSSNVMECADCFISNNCDK